ncbi:MAG TPA: hypothetical protein VFZ59_25845 [Verrucomicrobiae bacterium]|nr:hypothetical protein [Verrucomicrobiae bacterium]
MLLVLLGLPLIAWRAFLNLSINRELAKIRTAGFPANGEELNFWYAAVPDHQNAALVLTQAFALRQDYPDNRSNLINDFKFPKRNERLSAEQTQLLQGYLRLNEAQIRRADEALTLPAARYPLDFTLLMNTPLPHLTWLNDLAELHEFAALIALESGDFTAVGTNIMTILALVRTLDNEPSAISQLVRFKGIGRAFMTFERRANAGPLTAAEIANLTIAFDQTRVTSSSVIALTGDRALMIPYFRMTLAEYNRLHPPKPKQEPKANSPLPCHGPAILRLIGYYDLDYGTFLVGMRKAIAQLGKAPPENLRTRGYFARIGEESAKRQRSLSGLFFSNYVNSGVDENVALANQRLVLATLAIERFRNDNGRRPESLDELVPKYLAEVPEDPFTGMELEYRGKEKGYVIYSLGPDRENNEGLEKVDKKQSDDGRSYDITFTVER